MTGCLVGLDNDDKDTAIEFVQPHIYSEQADINRETKAGRRKVRTLLYIHIRRISHQTRPNRQDLKGIGSS